MDSEGTNGATNLNQCSLHTYGCTNRFPPHRSSEHCATQTHLDVMTKLMQLKQTEYDSASDELAINPPDDGEPLTIAAITVNNYRLWCSRLTELMAEMVSWSKPINTASNSSSNLNQIYNPIASPARQLIQQMDRSQNDDLIPQLYQNESELNRTTMSTISSLMVPSSAANHVNQHTEHEQDSSFASLQSTIESLRRSIDLLQTELAEKPVCTDGRFIWYRDTIFKKIGDAINKKQPHIDSLVFKTSMTGDRLWVRLYLNGKTDPNFISAHVHLYPRIGARFRGTVKFILVDQSGNYPLKHIIKSCSGEMTDVNDCLGFNRFIDKNILHQYRTRYVCDDSIYLLVWVEQTNEDKYAGLPPTVQDAVIEALILTQQTE